MEIFYSDGSIVGSALTGTGINVEKDVAFDIVLEAYINNLTPGNYYAIALAYEEDKQGHQMDTDRVEPAMFFTVIDDSKDSLIWLHPHWGHVRFPDINVLGVDKKAWCINLWLGEFDPTVVWLWMAIARKKSKTCVGLVS